MPTEITTEYTADEIQAAAAALDDKAREAAHLAMVADPTPSEYVTEYLHALARVLAQESAEQCADDEIFDPEDILDGDWVALREHAALLGVDLEECDYEIHKELCASYLKAARETW